MKININNEDIIIIIDQSIINFNYKIKEELEEYIKKLILNMRKRYSLKLSGYYKVNVYQNDNFGIIFEINKLDDLDFFPDLIDLKISVIYDYDIILEFDDYYLIDNKDNIYYFNNKFYLSVNKFSNNELYKISEFFKVIYGEEREFIVKKYKKLLFDKNILLC